MLLSKEELVKLRIEQKTNREIAEIFKISEAFVSYLMRKYDVDAELPATAPQAADHERQSFQRSESGTSDTSNTIIETTVQPSVSNKFSFSGPASSNENFFSNPFSRREPVINPFENQQRPESRPEPRQETIVYKVTPQPREEKVEPGLLLLTNNGSQVRLTRDSFIELFKIHASPAKVAQELDIPFNKVLDLKKKWRIDGQQGTVTTVKRERERKAIVDKDRLIQLQLEHKTDKKIAEILNISQLYVFHLRKKYGIPALRRQASLEAEITKEKLLEYQAQYKTDLEMARALKLTPIKIAQLRRRYSIAPLRKELQSSKYALSREELIELQKIHKSDRKIAEIIGKSLSYVFQMRKFYNVPILHKGESDGAQTVSDEKRVNFLFNKLIDIRRDQKLKQYEFAKRIGISDAHLRKFEHGMKYPRIYILLKMMNEFSINPNFLFVEDEAQKYLDSEQSSAS